MQMTRQPVGKLFCVMSPLSFNIVGSSSFGLSVMRCLTSVMIAGFLHSHYGGGEGKEGEGERGREEGRGGREEGRGERRRGREGGGGGGGGKRKGDNMQIH